MKKIYLLLSLSFLTLFTSCNNWLTVEPQATATKDKMFSSAMGYESALTGLYLSLITNIYSPTSFMMGGDLEYMAGNYPTPAESTTEYQFVIHNFSNSQVDSNLGALFTAYYKVIANANVLLEALNTQQVMDQTEADCIKGEALAIRAFCHSELLRLWGPAPGKVNAGITYLPYVTTFSTSPYQYLTYSNYVEKMMEDLTTADELLKKVDPILNYPNSILNQGYGMTAHSSDTFWYYRQKRFNVYGVEALLARMYLWTGDKQKAYQYAKEVINAENTDGTSKFTLGTQSNIDSQDYLFYPEHLAALDIHEFYDRSGAFSGRFASLVMTEQAFNRLFTNNTDIRRNQFMASNSMALGQMVYGTRKYMRMMSTDYGYPHSIPLVRLSELYLIMMETAPLDEANSCYQTFAGARGIPYQPMTESSRQQIVLNEYVREFWSEEQIFFAFKRLGISNSTITGTPLTTAYEMPLPTGETGKLI